MDSLSPLWIFRILAWLQPVVQRPLLVGQRRSLLARRSRRRGASAGPAQWSALQR
jgi:hypothetical protein